MTCLPLLHSGYTTTDDMYLALTLQQGKRWVGFGDATNSGRLQHVVSGHLLPFAYAWGNYWITKAFSVVAILASVAAMFATLRVLAGSARFATLAVVFFFAFIQNTQDHNLLTSYPVLSTSAMTAFWLSVAAWCLALEGRRWLGIVSVVLFVVSLLVYENFLVYACVFPVLTVLSRPGTWKARAWQAVRTPHVLATVMVFGAIVGFRVLFQTPIGREMMATEQYVVNMDVDRILQVIVRYGSSAFPMHYARVYRPLITDFYMGFGTFHITLRDLFSIVEPAWIVKALIVAYLTAVLTFAQTETVRRRGFLLFLALVLLTLTNLPLAVTAKYQAWAIDNYSHGYLTTYFVFFGVVVLLVLLCEGAVAWLSRRVLPAARALSGLLAVVAFVLCYGTDVINAHVARSERQMFEKWRTVDEWIASPYFKAIPAGSLILAPSLFEHYPGTVHVFDDYWTMYVSTMGAKDVEVLHGRSEWQERAKASGAADRLYFLEFSQEKSGEGTHLVFGRVSSALDGTPMASHELAVLSHAKADHFRIVGRLFDAPAACRARLFVDGVPTEGTFTDRFGAHVDVPRHAREWLWTRLSSDDAAMDPHSLLITESEVPVDGSVDATFGKGFQLDEIEYRWAEATAVATLRNREARPLLADVIFEVQAPGLPIGNTARLEATAGSAHAAWSLGRDYGEYSLRVSIPPTSTLDVRFSTDAPRVRAPLDARTLVMRFRPVIRVREVGCEKR
jgi:hypothetical protein